MPPLSPLLAPVGWPAPPHSHQGQASGILSCHFPSILGNPCGSFFGSAVSQQHSRAHAQCASLSFTPAAQKPLFEPTTGQDQCWGGALRGITGRERQKKHAPLPNSLSLTLDLRTSECVRYSVREKGFPGLIRINPAYYNVDLIAVALFCQSW